MQFIAKDHDAFRCHLQFNFISNMDIGLFSYFFRDDNLPLGKNFNHSIAHLQYTFKSRSARD